MNPSPCYAVFSSFFNIKSLSSEHNQNHKNLICRILVGYFPSLLHLGAKIYIKNTNGGFCEYMFRDEIYIQLLPIFESKNSPPKLFPPWLVITPTSISQGNLKISSSIHKHKYSSPHIFCVGMEGLVVLIGLRVWALGKMRMGSVREDGEKEWGIKGVYGRCLYIDSAD